MIIFNRDKLIEMFKRSSGSHLVSIELRFDNVSVASWSSDVDDIRELDWYHYQLSKVVRILWRICDDKL